MSQPLDPSAQRATPALDATLVETLVAAARDVSLRAHAPYSKFRVGCALYTASGATFVGCNVENATFGATVCAERSAVSAAVAAADTAFVLCVVYTHTAQPVAPCGICRQVLAEFASDLRVISACEGERRLDTTIGALLPEQFVL